MLDENEHSRKEDGRSLHRLLHKTEQQDATVEVDSAAFFSELPPVQKLTAPKLLITSSLLLARTSSSARV